MSATESEFRGYEELSKEEKAFIDEYAQNYKNTFPINIERRMDLETDQGRQIVEEHDDILSARRKAYESGELTDDDMYTIDDYREDVGEEAVEREDADTETAPEEYGIDVVVEDEDGTPIEDADVAINGEENWEFSLYGAGETVTVEADADGYTPESSEVTVDENTTVNLTLEPDTPTDDEETETASDSGEFEIPEPSEIDRDTLEEYEYYQLQQIAPEYGVQGNIKEEDMVEQILNAAEGTETEDEETTDTTDTRRGPQTAAEKEYDDLSPLQQRVVDNWVQDPEQNKGDIEDKADASPGYSARLFRKYGHIRDRRREAYEAGVLDDEHLNTPDFDEFIEDTSLPRDEWERIPEDEQPTGTPLEEVEGGDEFLETREESIEPEAEDEDTESEAADVDETPESEPEQLKLTDADTDAEAAASSSEVDSLRNEVSALSETVEDLQTNMQTIQETVSALGEEESELVERLETIEYHSGPQSSSSVGEQVQTQEGEQAVKLDTAEWVTVVRALASQEGSEDVLFQIIEQVD